MHITITKSERAFHLKIRESVLGETAGSLEFISNPNSNTGAVMIAFRTSKGVAKYATTMTALTSALEALKNDVPTKQETDEHGFIVTGDDPVAAVVADIEDDFNDDTPEQIHFGIEGHQRSCGCHGCYDDLRDEAATAFSQD